MNKLYSYEEFKKECLKNKYSKASYEANKIENSEKRMKKSYKAYVFRYNAIKKVKEYENKIREKYNKIKTSK